ncbi:hypothetical protein GCM10010329_19820 [Streptomyces spiroverticillatus]|uniref:Uncharacterized protein n=1 Tax=Streptomyces finlayi TaxID=67296 RepID=A0A918WU77_9ACTN|nr:hypothetical protein [Streptomyces finlayi]GGZ98387.1 hypothetical protein GCM10010329_19820 [Streptomyces spiroverticillatus]GHC83294.1 hypothetical protein GCM10010334_12260 [Streptomyces finlayi]
MGAHAAVPVRNAGYGRAVGVTRSTATPRIIGGLSATLGLIYGLYVGLVDRRGGELTAGNVWLGLLCGILFAALFAGVWTALRAGSPALRAVGFGVLTGVAMGFLSSRGDGSVLSSAGLGLAVGAGIGVSAYYYFYARTD